MGTNIKLAISIFAILLLAACGSESDGFQSEDSESNDQDNIVQTVKPGKIIGSISSGVDMYDYYYIYTQRPNTTTVSVTNESGMDLVLSKVSVLSQVQQRSNSNRINELGDEVESFKVTSTKEYGDSLYIEVSVLSGSGEYTLSIDVSTSN